MASPQELQELDALLCVITIGAAEVLIQIGAARELKIRGIELI